MMMMTPILVSCLLGLSAARGEAAPPAAQTSDYVVGPQDVLNITVFDEPPLSGRYTVDSDGALTFPWVGRLAVRGLTARAIEEQLRTLLADGYLKNPQVSVLVDQFRSRHIFVIGEVRAPGKYPLSGSMTLIEALAQAGSTTTAAGAEVLVVHPADGRGSVGPVLPDDRRDAEVVRINVRDLQSGKLSHNVAIRDGDTVFVPKAETFYVTGQVRNPGSFVLERGLTVLQALSLAGGLNDRGSARRLKIIRASNGRKKEIGVKLVDLVQSGDTIVVPQRFF